MDGINIKYYILIAILFVSIMIGLFIFNPGRPDPNDSLVNYELYHTEVIFIEDSNYLYKINYSIIGNIKRQCYNSDTMVIRLCKRCILNRIRVEIRNKINEKFEYTIYSTNGNDFEMYMINEMQNILPYFDIDRLHIKYIQKFELSRDTISNN